MIPDNAAGFRRVWFEDVDGNERELQLSPGARIMGIDIALDDTLDHTEICIVDHSHPGSFRVVGRFHAKSGTPIMQWLGMEPSDAPSLSQKTHITGREPGTVKKVDKLEGLDAAR